MHRRLSKYLLIALLLYWVAMFVATHIPGDKVPEHAPGSDKLAHFAAYAVLAWLAAMLLWALGWWNWKSAIALGVAAAVYGAVDEWLQPYFGRSAEVGDWIADMLGAVFGLIVFFFTESSLSSWFKKHKTDVSTMKNNDK